MKRITLMFLFALVSQSANAFPSYAMGDFRGSSLMTSDEIRSHIANLLSMQKFDVCESYMAAHEEELQKRALAQHVSLPEKSGDPCKVMRFFGRVH